jgi:hypothetical protein
MNAALDYLRQTNFDVRDEDVERLSPLISDHINFVGFPARRSEARGAQALSQSKQPGSSYLIHLHIILTPPGIFSRMGHKPHVNL